MRTTIKLDDDNRDTLLSIAQERGQKGFSAVVEEAIAFYLSERSKPIPLAEPPAPPPGRWQRIGEKIDRTAGDDAGLLALVRAIVRGGLSRVRLLRA